MPPSSMPRISTKIAEISRKLPDGVRLVAVSKFHPLPSLLEAYGAGQRLFGESRADELVAKAAAMPADVEWHFIGHLQTNKVRRVVACASVIESIDSLRLLQAVSAEAVKAGRTVRVLLQVHVAAEETKTGFEPEQLVEAAAIGRDLPGIEIAGVMGMATNTDDADRIAADFDAIARVAERVRMLVPGAREISMGMSGDWPLAVARGATLVRIGSDIFGPREY